MVKYYVSDFIIFYPLIMKCLEEILESCISNNHRVSRKKASKISFLMTFFGNFLPWVSFSFKTNGEDQ